MLLRKITLAKLFGPKVPNRHLTGFAVVLNQGRRGKTFAQELRREISTSGLHFSTCQAVGGGLSSASPCHRLVSRAGRDWCGQEHPAWG